MTLSPVFRSQHAIEVLRAEGVWDRLSDAALGQRAAVGRVRADLRPLIDERFLAAGADDGDDTGMSLEFIQEFFFLILFRSLLESVGVQRTRLDLYSELNFCIQGTVAAADNLFDGQDKSLLPLSIGTGRRFGAILELMSFERLAWRVLGRGTRDGSLTEPQAEHIQRELLSRMAAIGTLEGSEEAGVLKILEVDEMVAEVHRLRGGALFDLGFVAPFILEGTPLRHTLGHVREAISRLGTAFQMVDDLTDVWFDTTKGRHNLLTAQIHHQGSAAERSALERVRRLGSAPAGLVEVVFVDSARAVLHRAQVEARRSLEALHALGFWFPPTLSDQLVRAIVGLDGVAMMDALPH